MTGKNYEGKLFLDIPFGEALERFAETEPKQVAAGIAKSKKAKPSGGKLKPPPDLIAQSKNVVKLARKRKREGL